MAIIIIKNTTTNEIMIDDLAGQAINAGDTITLSDLYTYDEMSDSIDLKDYVSSGDIIVNDGSSNLTIQEGVEHLTPSTYHETPQKLTDLPEIQPIETDKVLVGVDENTTEWVDFPTGGSDAEGYLHFGYQSNQYLSAGVVASIGLNLAGYIMPKDGIIDSIGIITDEANYNQYEVTKNGNIVAVLPFSNIDKDIINDLDVSFNAGDILNLQFSNSSSSISDISQEYIPDANTLWLAHYDTDDRSKKDIKNSSTIAKGITGRFVGNIYYAGLGATGKFNKCLTFNGHHYVQMLNHIDYSVHDSTIEFFFNASDLPDWSCMFSKLSADVQGLFFGTKNDQIYIEVGGESQSCGSITEDTWYHFAVVMGTGGLKVFLDGSMIHSDSTTGGLFGNYELMSLGCSLEENDKDWYKYVSYHFKGLIDELRISDRRRYENNFTVPISEFVNDSKTLGLWHFNETSGFLVYDESDTIQNGTMMANGSLSEIKTDVKKFGTSSLKLNGSKNDWIRSNHIPEYESTTITIEGWLRPHKDKDTGIVFQKGGEDVEGGLSIFWSKHQKRLEVRYEGASTSRMIHSNSSSFPRNEWNHFAVTITSDRLEVLVDGAVQDYEDLTTDYQNVWLNNKSDIYWGRNGIVGSYYSQVSLLNHYLDQLYHLPNQ